MHSVKGDSKDPVLLLKKWQQKNEHTEKTVKGSFCRLLSKQKWNNSVGVNKDTLFGRDNIHKIILNEEVPVYTSTVNSKIVVNVEPLILAVLST